MACSNFLRASMSPPSSSSSSYSSLPISRAPTIFRWTFGSKQLRCSFNGRSYMQRFMAVANTNAPQGKRNSGADVAMVDPLEAKRLAAQQMQEIRAREELKSHQTLHDVEKQNCQEKRVEEHETKRRQAEAINGALALIGLTAGLVVEGRTGKGILGQLAGYLGAIASLFGHLWAMKI